MIDQLKAMQANLAAMQLGEQPAVQASSLPGFSVRKAQDLSNPGNPSNRDPSIRKSQHVATESASSAGERPTKTAGFLPTFSTERAQYPNGQHPTGQSSHIKFESPRTGPNSLITDQVQKPNFGGVPTQYGLQPRVQPARWFKVYTTFRKRTDGDASQFCSHYSNLLLPQLAQITFQHPNWQFAFKYHSNNLTA